MSTQRSGGRGGNAGGRGKGQQQSGSHLLAFSYAGRDMLLDASSDPRTGASGGRGRRPNAGGGGG
eukprot:CAMPEP_0174833712 /NCGR_PEP_ID=MMETSP1114-20130205/4401_1 /TAXON_ID=312471 /ORGANISM="Neobodo designis, Strain CCAP 1951/1" /LENGTH=64 /DNA_ID=CAMNT_0016067603 /DNA_START=9 /DNA_END=199 /DNA_ORIENTATION=+